LQAAALQQNDAAIAWGMHSSLSLYYWAKSYMSKEKASNLYNIFHAKALHLLPFKDIPNENLF
jgi:hypothetical protein